MLWSHRKLSLRATKRKKEEKKNTAVTCTNIKRPFFVHSSVLFHELLMSFAKCWTYFALTLASVVLPKFSGLSPVGIMRDDRESGGDVLTSKRLQGKPLLLCLEAEATMKQCHYSERSFSVQFNAVSLISMKFHTKFKHRESCLPPPFNLSGSCLLLSWQPVNGCWFI